MKQLMLLFAILILVLKSSQAQDSLHNSPPDVSAKSMKTPAPVKFSSEYFAVKSSKLKTGAWVCFSLGTVLGVTGWIVYNNRKDYNLDHIDEAILNTYGAQVLMIAGSTMVLISIPLFIQSVHYKNKALNMSALLKMEPYQDLRQTGMTRNLYPAVGLKIRF